MTEAQLQSAVLDLCKLLGVHYYHPYDSRRSVPGWPDLVLCGTRGLIFRELKSQTGKPAPEQTAWFARLLTAGQDISVWRPEDLRSGRIHRELTAIR
jgi:hypothetical protein